MKLTAMMFLTVDGVYQGPGGLMRTDAAGYDRGGWIAPLSDGSPGGSSSVYERCRTRCCSDARPPGHLGRVLGAPDGGDPVRHRRPAQATCRHDHAHGPDV